MEFEEDEFFVRIQYFLTNRFEMIICREVCIFDQAWKFSLIEITNDASS